MLNNDKALEKYSEGEQKEAKRETKNGSKRREPKR